MLFTIPSAVIGLFLLAALVACIEAGHRMGRRRAPHTLPAVREHINAIQAAILGLLALLLAFTFSLALQRHDSRSEAVVDEANAIGTAFLRTDLLKSPLRDEARQALARYLDLRVQEATLPLTDVGGRPALVAQATGLQGTLWSIAARAAQADAASHGAAQFVQAVNDLIDSFGRRDAALARHVPALVTALLFATFLLSGGILGFAAGVGDHRPSAVTYVLVVLMVVLVFIVLDLDRPRRGVIQVSHQSLVSLQDSVRDALRPGAPPAALSARP